MDEINAYERWVSRETQVKNALHRYVTDAVRSIEEKGDDYDSIDLIIELLYATVISHLQEYLEDEYEYSYSEGLDGRLDSRPDELAAYAAIYADVDGKTFEDRVRVYMNTLYADVTLTEDLTSAADRVKNSLDLLTMTDGHRVRADARQSAGEDLASVGYSVTKTWRSVKIPTTRDTHYLLDGTTIPIDGWFQTVNGRAKYPGGFGVACEDVNCLCYLQINAVLPNE